LSRWLLLICMAGWLLPATARVVPTMPVPDRDPSALTVQQSGGMSLEQATQAALRAFPGRVARAETLDRGGRRVHEIRILGEDGRVRSFRFDAASGRAM
jgi:uncharacterized membrane protein YkoI